ncbi:MAG TPA: alanine racemase [Acidimicrobiales bacterium]|nr:alanine racemase [Acidimicrobiales bacterium]
MNTSDITTPALIVDSTTFEHNLDTMAKVLPGARLRPHVKAHKTTAIAAAQAAMGHVNFTCATPREAAGMARAGLGADLLVANEIVDTRLLGNLVDTARSSSARLTIAVDSHQTIEAAAISGIREVLIDVNVGLPRCGCRPQDAGQLAELAKRSGLIVRGVMGYEGHAVGVEDRTARQEMVEQSMALLQSAHQDVGGTIVSAGGTGSYDLNSTATEIQAGSYALMDTAYGKLGLPFRQALSVLSTVISKSQEGWYVCDAGLKSLGMDHGNPTISGAEVWFCSDEHITFSDKQDSEDTSEPFSVGSRIQVIPAHIDPTVAYHDKIYLVSGEEIIDTWEVDLRQW